MVKSQRFKEKLTKAVRIIAACEGKPITTIQDELGYAMGREGGASIEHWRKGYVPDEETLAALAQVLVTRGGFLDAGECKAFFRCVGYPGAEGVCDDAVPQRHGPHGDEGALTWALSPFVVGPPITRPRQFFGRERELEQIFTLWRRFPMQHMAVVGLHRSGKTSLLHYVRAITRAPPETLRPGQRTDWLPHPQRYRWVFVHFQLEKMRRRTGVLRHILTSLELPVPTSCTLDAFVEVILQHLQTPAVILMDEISAGLASEELDEAFWWSLRALANNYANGNLAFLITAHGIPMDLARDYGKPSPFFNIFHTLELGPFTEAEAHALIASAPRAFAPEDVAWIMAHSGGWPSLLQILCQVRLRALEEAQSDARWREEGLRQIAPYGYLLDA